MTETTPLRGQRVVILVEADYDHVDLEATRAALGAAGATVHVVGPMQGQTYVSRNGPSIVAEFAAGTLRVGRRRRRRHPRRLRADRIRLRHAMVDLVRDAVEAGKPVAAI